MNLQNQIGIKIDLKQKKQKFFLKKNKHKIKEEF